MSNTGTGSGLEMGLAEELDDGGLLGSDGGDRASMTGEDGTLSFLSSVVAINMCRLMKDANLFDAASIAVISFVHWTRS